MVTSTVSEHQRQHYLQAIGVQPWFARFCLPASAPAQRCEWPEPVEFSHTGDVAGQCESSTSSSTSLHSLKSSLVTAASPDTAAPVIQAIDTPLPLPTIPQTDTQTHAQTSVDEGVGLKADVEAPNVRLYVVPIEGEGLVIGELPYLGEAFSSYHLQLLADLLRACHRLPDQPLEARHFQWPVCEKLVAPYGVSGAVEALQGFLRNQLALDQRRWLLLLGPQATELVLPSAESFDALRGPSEEGGVVRVVTHGLTQLMRLPSLKAEAWQDLQGLKIERAQQ